MTVFICRIEGIYWKTIEKHFEMTTNIKLALVGILVFFAFGVSGCGDDDSSSKSPPVKDLKATVRTNLDEGNISVTNNDGFSYKQFVVHLNESSMFDEGY